MSDTYNRYAEMVAKVGARYAVSEAIKEIEDLQTQVAALQAQVAGHCERIAAASEVIARNAERSATAALTAWVAAGTGYSRRVVYEASGAQGGPQRRGLYLFDDGPGQHDVIVLAGDPPHQQPSRPERWRYLGAAATLDDLIRAALALWAELYPEGA
jgi:hypothetical protein